MQSRLMLILILSPLFLANPNRIRSQENDDDLLLFAIQSVPQDWTASLTASSGRTFLTLVTPPMDTRSSYYGGGPSGTFRSPIVVRFEILPRYSNAMLSRIKEHNRPIKERLSKLGKGNNEYSSIANTMIPEPIFLHPRYSFGVGFPSHVPANAEGKNLLIDSLKGLTRTWKPLDDSTTIEQEFARILTW